MPTVKGVLQKYHEGQNIFRREAVACLVAHIEQLEKYIAAQQSAQTDICPRCKNTRSVPEPIFGRYNVPCPACEGKYH